MESEDLLPVATTLWRILRRKTGLAALTSLTTRLRFGKSSEGRL